ncbi:hypothetical protein G4X40_01000 [Rhodococcus sp. D2-41]|uniref:Bacteriocin biosynthesis cyclodehydratase domain-containing protein n=1 Tax=Speluncibacter jeojiensis TaxID=2710754 RepID=A0A9X4RC11_9ACTN|nr:hypothetical protein [Rhodococcus sp. D2-41]MDG3008719.1 hypothetical protein [Rhodococcus sp. D2-41]MDG3013073.1 hypothetical protein [Corynebacteriales bacterium D3-21]
MTAVHDRPLALRRDLAVLIRPTGRIQIGSDPERALLVTPPDGVPAARFAAWLRSLDGSAGPDQLRARVAESGAHPAEVDAVLRELEHAGLVTAVAAAPSRSERRVRVHGPGPLGDGLCAALTGDGAQVSRSRRYTCDLAVDRWQTDLVVLTDDQVADPRLVMALIEAGVPHLQVRLRDGVGIVGPLVFPGSTSCLGCADLHRRDRDPEWPHLAAQLLGTIGCAPTATVMATTAVALHEIDRVFRRVADRPPATLDATVEVELDTNALVTRPWSPHPLCRCRTLRDASPAT